MREKDRNIFALHELLARVFREKKGFAPKDRLEMNSHGLLSMFQTYEAVIHGKGKKAGFRFSIRAIGEGGGSKSKAYHVKCGEIFGVHDAVFIVPPVPTVSVEEYVERLAVFHEASCAASPKITLLVPEVGVILRNFNLMFNSEGDCRNFLKANPHYHQFFKLLGQNFVYISIFSDSEIMDQTVRALHGSGESLFSFLYKMRGVLSDHYSFEREYGHGMAWVLEDMEEFQHRYRQAASALAAKSNVPDITARQTEDWFIGLVSGRPAREEGLIDNALAVEINGLFLSVGKDYAPALKIFRGLFAKKVEKINFDRNKAETETWIEELLFLLARLWFQGIAFRDCKFANIIASRPLGLIDPESVVIPGHPALGKPRMLGGTAAYAVPASLLPMPYLEALYPGTAKAFLLQDWNAILAMVYFVATGRNLYGNAAESYKSFHAGLAAKFREKRPAREILGWAREENSRFWDVAALEFSQGLNSEKEKLESLVISVGSETAAMFSEALGPGYRAAPPSGDGKIRMAVYKILKLMFGIVSGYYNIRASK
jgi:hypothetical protein